MGSPFTLPFYPFILFMTPFFLIRGNNVMQKIVMLAMFLAYLFASILAFAQSDCDSLQNCLEQAKKEWRGDYSSKDREIKIRKRALSHLKRACAMEVESSDLKLRAETCEDVILYSVILANVSGVAWPGRHNDSLQYFSNLCDKKKEYGCFFLATIYEERKKFKKAIQIGESLCETGFDIPETRNKYNGCNLLKRVKRKKLKQLSQIKDVVGRNDNFIRNPAYDFWTVTIIELVNQQGTNKKSPLVRFRIDKVVAGNSKPATIIGSWPSPIHPKVSQKFIIVTLPDIEPPTDIVPIFAIYKFTSENIKRVHSYMTPRYPVYVVVICFALIVLMPLVGVFLLVKKYPPKVIVWIPLLSIGAYLYYERGVSPYAAIRIDLLLILPILVFTVLLWCMSFAKRFRE